MNKVQVKSKFSIVNLSEVHKLLRMKLSLLEAEHQQNGNFSLGYDRNFLITTIALVFVILKHSLQRRGEFHLFTGPVAEYLLVNSTASRFLMAACVKRKF